MPGRVIVFLAAPLTPLFILPRRQPLWTEAEGWLVRASSEQAIGLIVFCTHAAMHESLSSLLPLLLSPPSHTLTAVPSDRSTSQTASPTWRRCEARVPGKVVLRAPIASPALLSCPAPCPFPCLEWYPPVPLLFLGCAARTWIRPMGAPQQLTQGDAGDHAWRPDTLWHTQPRVLRATLLIANALTRTSRRVHWPRPQPRQRPSRRRKQRHRRACADQPKTLWCSSTLQETCTPLSCLAPLQVLVMHMPLTPAAAPSTPVTSSLAPSAARDHHGQRSQRSQADPHTPLACCSFIKLSCHV